MRALNYLSGVVLAAAAVAGCSSSTTFDPMGSGRSNEDSTQLAAYAASAKYPSDVQPKTDTKLAAMFNGDNVRIVNFSNEPVRDANVWVNNTFVHKIAIVPPLGTVTVNKSTFYDPTGRNLSSANVTPTTVTVQTGNTVWSTLGPVVER